MLKLTEIQDIKIEDISSHVFDLGIFASGYESRSSYLIRNLDESIILNKMVFGFKNFRHNKIREENDQIFKDKGFSEINILGQGDSRLIYDLLIETDLAIFSKKKEIKILIDYASMSRMWYSSILNFFRTLKDINVEVFLNYSPGEYKDFEFIDYSYSSIDSLPSHEGSLSSNTKTLLILGIGFSPYLIKSVIEEIEPNEIIGILPMPSVNSSYDKKIKEIKNELLVRDIKNWVKCPVKSLESTFRIYAELTNEAIDSKDILFLSVGPKILTMASLLVSQRFDQVTSLYLKTPKLEDKDVKATGEFICNRIKYIP
tara:strand:+ start:16753 stop:17697 length:945 start_codon:yes stop_codon:yes gene_type:complete